MQAPIGAGRAPGKLAAGRWLFRLLTSIMPSPRWSGGKASGFAASSASTTTRCSASPARAGNPDLPDACKEPFVPLLWVKVLELLGRVPEGSTARFLEDGTLPD
jgi:hypothetical protein